MNEKISAFEKIRKEYKPKLPSVFGKGATVDINRTIETTAAGNAEKIKELFPNLYGQAMLEFKTGNRDRLAKPVNVAVILSGGQAPGGHNVIAGLFDGLKSLHPNCRLYGFKGGPSGLIDNKYLEITVELLAKYRNTGGFDMIGSGRTKLEKADQFEKVRQNCEKLDIRAIAIIGGDDSNTNACLLAEYYKNKNVEIQVIGCPKTIDGDLKNEYIETSFGFDSACKVYSELIGNIARDANSAKKYWHFIRLMGRSASHITLECALQTQPNIALIAEEVAEKKHTLSQIADHIASVIAQRANAGCNFGIVLVPEGLIEFIPEIKKLISELNEIMAREEKKLEKTDKEADKIALVKSKLPDELEKVYSSLPHQIQLELIRDRDPHGNVQVSLIETEKLLIHIVEKKLKIFKEKGQYNGKFSPQNHFLGYEGRSVQPSNFDSDYCYSLGFTAASLIGGGYTGYMASVRNLTDPAEKWKCGGVPLTTMMNIERRHGEDRPVIKKALVDLNGKPFKTFEASRSHWAISTKYVYPGPIQFFGPSELCDKPTETLLLERN